MAVNKVGDLIVGTFTETGKQLTPAKFVGTPEQIAALRDKFDSHASAYGKKVEPISVVPQRKVKAKKKDVASTVPMTYVNEEQENIDSVITRENAPIVSKKRVTFSNAFGSMRVKVESIMENRFGISLVYSNDDDLDAFIPKEGEMLDLTTPDGEVHKVYYIGLLFNWVDGVKRIMVLCKVPDGYADTHETTHGSDTTEISTEYRAE